MKLKIGQYIDEETGNVYDRYLIMGRTIKDAQMQGVGSKNISMLTITVSVSKYEPLVNLKLWGWDAAAYNGIRGKTIVIADAIEKSREYNGKTYLNYEPLFLMAEPERVGSNKRSKTVKPEDPDGFVEIENPIGLPF